MECKGTKSDKAIFLTSTLPPDQLYQKLEEHKNLYADQLMEVQAKAKAKAKAKAQEAMAAGKAKAKTKASTSEGQSKLL